MMLLKIAVAALAGAFVVAFSGVGRPDDAHGQQADGNRTIAVSGTGAVVVVPDRARFSFGVESRGRTAADALAANATAMRNVIAAVKAGSVDDRDIQTQQVSLSPIYSDDGESIVGYSASNSVGVLVRKLSSAGELIDKAVTAGANQIYGPGLEKGDREELYRKALEAAIADARAKAETIASATGLTLGRATSVQETSSAPPMPYMERAAAASDAPPVEAGTQEVQATVSVTFAAT